ncbi:SMP-30/gluconolactonase/LRE family protein [Telmatocola sphagniphila]|uniref:SMP-30/gluconolactonase/LRE family protein n=2 Tax=Telmatocola sphagniphila TaxID=1123043 RepID=A0A8E6F0P3_9BACT|nr:SMP-30/gluconolactonase/LRE family protein [Telmatocola sphagniphila]
MGLGLSLLAQEKKNEPPKLEGEMLRFEFKDSKIFPGTTRTVSVYVPRQYDGKTPACVHVNQDGIQFNAPQVFDKLIAAREIPVMIGVFIPPGVVKAADSSKALDRFNRSYEYDGLGDAYARFLLEEILPAVEKLQTQDGRAIRLSKSGNDRSIAGTSSGAIAAFTAAWERPDAFTRVFSGIGTYVGLRGGHNYPTLIRKMEPKPIRIFLEDGSNDNNIYGGDWWIANQAMERSFQFMGYEVDHNWGEGRHDGRHSTELFPDAFKWLWKNWPEPVKTPEGSADFKKTFFPKEGWKLVGEGYQATEGPAVNANGEVFFNDVPRSKTYKVDLEGKVSVFLEANSRSDGQIFGPDGRLYAVASGVDKIIAYDPKGVGADIASGFKGNDIVVLQNGSKYVTFPDWANRRQSEIIYISPMGEKKVVDKGLRFSNGICTSPDQTLLYVSDSATHWVYSYQIQPDGSLKYKQKFFHLHVRDSEDESGADGMRVDTEGNLYVATRYGIQICDPVGRVHMIVPTPNGKLANLTFGGKNFDTIYACCGDKIYSRKVKIKGCNAFQDPIKPPRPGL